MRAEFHCIVLLSQARSACSSLTETSQRRCRDASDSGVVSNSIVETLHVLPQCRQTKTPSQKPCRSTEERSELTQDEFRNTQWDQKKDNSFRSAYLPKNHTLRREQHKLHDYCQGPSMYRRNQLSTTSDNTIPCRHRTASPRKQQSS